MIFGRNPYKEGWRIRRYNELQKLVKGEGVKYRRTERIKLWEHLNIIVDISLVLKIIDWKPIGIITKGRPKNRWRGEVIKWETLAKSSKVQQPEMFRYRRPKPM